MAMNLKVFWIAQLAALAFGKPSCRCLYGQECFPTSDLSALESQLSQPLLHPSPPESACYPASNPSENCTEVTVNYTNGTWHSNQPGSMQFPNFETFIFSNGSIEACYLNATMGFPCGQGSVPTVGADARSVGDVQTVVKFASNHNLRLAIKNTGHDFLGRSTARGSFLLWTHNMKSITYNDWFVPDGAPTSETYKALTVGAGVQWYEAYDAADKQGRFIIGGLSAGASVGAAGGWVMGGGHSGLSARHGLGVDNVIQFNVVTANGDYLTVNSHQHSDLFWALRGGGGGTFAVVLYVTYRTHDKFPLTVVNLLANFSSPEVAQSVITEHVKLHPTLADARWGGYSFLSNDFLGLFYLAPNISEATANATMEPLISYAKNVSAAFYTATVPYDSFYAWYTANFITNGQVGTSHEIGSRLLPREQAEQHPEKVAEAMLALDTVVAINFIAGGAVSKVDPDATALHPDWRKALALIEFGEGWTQGDPFSAIQAARKKISDNIDIVDEIAPGSATYFNEASLFEKDFKKTFFGSHYGKLKSIKDIYDPQGLFIVASGVGSDEWDASLNCRL